MVPPKFQTSLFEIILIYLLWRYAGSTAFEGCSRHVGRWSTSGRLDHWSSLTELQFPHVIQMWSGRLLVDQIPEIQNSLINTHKSNTSRNHSDGEMKISLKNRFFNLFISQPSSSGVQIWIYGLRELLCHWFTADQRSANSINFFHFCSLMMPISNWQFALSCKFRSHKVWTQSEVRIVKTF